MFPIHHARTGAASASRRLPAILAIAALLAAFALPAPAAAQPGPNLVEGRTLAVVLQWLDGLLAGFGLELEGPADPEGPVATALPGNCTIDPDGTPCPDPLAAPSLPEHQTARDTEEPRTR